MNRIAWLRPSFALIVIHLLIAAVVIGPVPSRAGEGETESATFKDLPEGRVDQFHGLPLFQGRTLTPGEEEILLRDEYSAWIPSYMRAAERDRAQALADLDSWFSVLEGRGTTQEVLAEVRRGFQRARGSHANESEIDRIETYARQLGLSFSRTQIRESSRYWLPGDSDDAVIGMIALETTIVLGALLGAAAGLSVYYLEYRFGRHEFTCRGAAKAMISGSILGALGPVLAPIAVLGAVIGTADLVAILLGYLEAFGVVADGGSISTTANVISFMTGLVADAIYATPFYFGAVNTLCGTISLATARPGNLAELKAWIQGEFAAGFQETAAGKIAQISVSVDEDLASMNATEVERLAADASLELTATAGGMLRAGFQSGESIRWAVDFRAARPGSFDLILKLFRRSTGALMGSFATVVTTVADATSTYQATGSVPASSLLTSFGAGEYEIRIQLRDRNNGASVWVVDADQNPKRWPFEVVQNGHRPSVSMDNCASLPPIMKCDVFVVDPDGVAPQSVLVSWDGVDHPLALPSSCSWAAGCTMTFTLGNATSGVHSARARVNDGVFTAETGLRSVRVANPPYPEFPYVELGEAQVPHHYRVRWRDNVGGIPGQDVYLHTASNGNFRNSSAQPIAKVVTGADGWAEFDYVPFSSGNHTLSIRAEQYELSQTSYAEAGCQPPSTVRLDDPYNTEDDVPTSLNLSWYWDDDVETYDVYLGTTNPPPFRATVDAVYDVNKQTLSVSGLQPGQQYFWKVRAHAICSDTAVSESRINTFYTLGTPGPVTLVQPENLATGVSTSVVLDWNNVTSTGTVLYDLYLGKTNPPPFFEAMGVESFKLATLDPNATYFWKVVAKSSKDAALTSTSNTWQFTTGSGSAATVTLNVVKDAGIRAGTYANRNYGGQVGGAAEQTAFAVGNADDLYLDRGDYAARGVLQFDVSTVPSGVTIQNATLTLPIGGGWGDWSGSPAMYFDPFSAAWSESTITWNNRPARNLAYRATGVFPSSGYNPLRNNVTDLVQAWLNGTIPNHGLEVSLPSWEATPRRGIWFRQREAGSSVSTLSVTYPVPCLAPGNPIAVSPLHGASQQPPSLTLDWADVAGAQSYRVYFGPSSPPSQVAVVSESQFTVSGLSSATTYYWKIEALAACDASITSVGGPWAFMTQTFVTGPTAPSSLNAVARVDRIDLSWTDSSLNEEGFKVERRPSGSQSWVLAGSVPADQGFFSDATLTTCESFVYRVRAFNAAGESGNSNEAAATGGRCAPSGPSNMTAQRLSDGAVFVSWSDTSDSETSHAVQRRPNSSSPWVTIASLPADNTGFTDTGAESCSSYEYRVLGINSFGQTASSVASVGPGASCSGQTIDFNGDGKSDLLWRQPSTGKNVLWAMNGASRLTYTNLLDVAGTTWSIGGTGDFSGDGKPDILWRNATTGQNVVWIMNGTARQSYLAILSVPAPWEVGGVGDFDADGDADIVWRNPSTGQNVLWTMNGTARQSYTNLITVPGAEWRLGGAGDLTGDGKADLVWRNYTTGQNALWTMNGATRTSSAILLAIPDPAWRLSAIADYSGDGKADIVWRNVTTGQNALWTMNGASRLSYTTLLPVSDASWAVAGPR